MEWDTPTPEMGGEVRGNDHLELPVATGKYPTGTFLTC